MSLDSAKRHLNVDYNRDDDYIATLIEASQEYFERRTSNRYGTQVYLMTMRCFNTIVYLPNPPTASVIIQYYDGDNDIQTLDEDEFYLTKSDKQKSYVTPVTSWPSTYDRPDGVQISMTTSSEVPALLLHGMKLLLATWYENRESEITGTITSQFDQAGIERIVKLLTHERYA